MEIHPVNHRHDQQAIIDPPVRFYANDRNWIPPLQGIRDTYLSILSILPLDLFPPGFYT